MRKEVIVKYFSDDGIEFASEQACYRYEASINIHNKHLIFLDKNLKRISGIDLTNVYFFGVLDKIGLNQIRIAGDLQCCDIPPYIGFWFYDENIGELIRIEDYIQDMEKEIKKQKKRKNQEVLKALQEQKDFVQLGLLCLQKI